MGIGLLGNHQSQSKVTAVSAFWRAIALCRPVAVRLLLAVAAVFAITTAAGAQTMPFASGPSISTEYCQIVINQSGVMTTNVGETVLSSKETGGSGGIATVTARRMRPSGIARFSVTLEAPTTFTSMPVGGDTGVTFATRFSGVSIYRGRNFNERRGNRRVRLRRNGDSITEITGHLIATRTGLTFPAGTYDAVATLRCE